MLRLTECVLPGICELPRAVRCALLAWWKTAGCSNVDANAPILQMGSERMTRLIFTFRSRTEDNLPIPAASCTTNCVKCSNLPCVQTSANEKCEEIYEMLATMPTANNCDVVKSSVTRAGRLLTHCH